MSKDGRTRSSDTISTRLHSPYREWLAARAEQTGLKKSHLLKLLVMIGLDADMLGVHERLKGIENEIRSLRKDFDEAVEK